MTSQGDHHGDSGKLGSGLKPNVAGKTDGESPEVNLPPEELSIHSDLG